ncbi:protein arginine methyltransferase NDUFAF7, mitochondrial [Halyomorpha halys]|uniref:protein arginine methyltransferase NDUFAF7, mitochondrial n=1 Tax=Halyomorpha halys TaxID=286706 RepID=UPI0006D4C9E9|nr:protein arginine methyltransferase NDUFAF7, mitochondrial [Halyomorpha halys]
MMFLQGLRKIIKTVLTERKIFFSSIPLNKSDETCFNLLKSRINFAGPLTVYDYMKEVLTNPVSGYYVTKNVIGKQGDFITSPEISQLLGEMVALWTLNEWTKLGSPKPFQLVELGPGKGSMMHDILRVCKQLKLDEHINVHFVEVSDELSKAQGDKLCTSVLKHDNKSYYQEGKTENNVPIYWHKAIQDVPKNFTCILAHEFFDALPVHILKQTVDGWREVLIDLTECCSKLRYVISPAPTPACVFSKYSNGRDYFEISPQSGLILEHIACTLEEHGGFVLIIDYGHDGEKKDTFRGFRNHQLVDPLVSPGTSDLTADVDFAFLKNVTKDKLLSFGPVPQRSFLKELHIDVRLQVLLKNCKNEKEKNDILSGYHMIMDSDKMGECFKVMSLFPSVLKELFNDYPVVGFVNK